MVCISSYVHRSPNYVLKGAKIVFGVGPEEQIEVKIRKYWISEVIEYMVSSKSIYQ